MGVWDLAKSIKKKQQQQKEYILKDFPGFKSQKFEAIVIEGYIITRTS